jgi:hypothetical protein
MYDVPRVMPSFRTQFGDDGAMTTYSGVVMDVMLT